MNLYFLGSEAPNESINSFLSQWSPQKIQNEDEMRIVFDQTKEKVAHFIMEVPELNESKYQDLKNLPKKLDHKVRFIVFYQTLKASPLINKLHGAEILLIGPEERSIAKTIMNRFFQNKEPLFRRWQRFQLVNSGTLSLLSDSKANQKTQIVDFGPHGAQLELSLNNHQNEFKKKDFVVLEYISHDGKKIRMQSRVSWVKIHPKSYQIGIQFISREV